MNTWIVALSVGLISGAIFLATAPQRELARRELERQDAAHAIEAAAQATVVKLAQQANELVEQVRGNGSE